MKVTEIAWADGRCYNVTVNGYVGSIYKVINGELVSNLYGKGIQGLLTLQDIAEANFEDVIDWSSVAVDTKIRVGASSGGELQNRYFASYKDGKINAWTSGRTSYSANDENDTTTWIYAGLAEKERIGIMND